MMEKVDFKCDDGSKIYFTSDSHAGHENIIKFCKRPFGSVQEMNDEMVRRWNEKVPEDGIVFHLGDFAWGGYNVWKEFRERLNGDIYLIKGNHCLKNMTPMAKELFKDVNMQMRIEIEERKIWLNHFPLLCYSGVYRDFNGLEYNLFGHVHLSNHKERNTGRDCERCYQMLFPTQYDVGVDFNEFAPISWNELNEKIKQQVENNENLKMWVK
jgi:calcineurin-like phosphoesterase family protein